MDRYYICSRSVQKEMVCTLLTIHNVINLDKNTPMIRLNGDYPICMDLVILEQRFNEPVKVVP
jgi:hypothetical protein